MRSARCRIIAGILSKRCIGLQPPQPVAVLLQRGLVVAARGFLGAVRQVRGRSVLLHPLDLLEHALAHLPDVLGRGAEAHLRCTRRRAAAAAATGPTDTV